MKKLNLGCGKDIRQGWINIDLLPQTADNYIQYDLTKGLPDSLEDLDLIYSSHFWEHLTETEADSLAHSCIEKLRSGGVFRISVPDFELICKKYLEKDWGFFLLVPWDQFSHFSRRSMVDVLNYTAYQNVEGIQEHKTLWDKEKAVAHLKSYGLKDVKVVDFDSTIDPSEAARKRYSLYCQGVKE